MQERVDVLENYSEGKFHADDLDIGGASQFADAH